MIKYFSTCFLLTSLLTVNLWADTEEPSERKCERYKSEIRRLSSQMMDLKLNTPINAEGGQNLETLGELQKQHAKYMAELVLLNSMKEMNRRSVDVLSGRAEIDAFNNLDSETQKEKLPDSPEILNAMRAYQDRSSQLATHQILNNALSDLSRLDTSFVRSTGETEEALNELKARICRFNRDGVICKIDENNDEQQVAILNGLLNNYVTTVKNSSEENPSISIEELSSELNRNLSIEFLAQYNDHYRTFKELAEKLPVIQNCTDDQCRDDSKQDFMNHYHAFTESEADIIGRNVPQTMPVRDLNRHLKKYADLAKVASRDFDKRREMEEVLQRALSSAFPNHCKDPEDHCTDLFTINNDGTIAVSGDISFELDSSEIDNRISMLMAKVRSMNTAIEETKQKSDFKHLNGIINYLAEPFNYRQFCGYGNSPTIEATCGYNGTGNRNDIDRIGSLLRDGDQILAHTFNRTPRVRLEQVEAFCARERERHESEGAFNRKWGQTCSLTDKNVELRDDALPNQTITQGQFFDPETGQRYDIEYPAPWENYFTGAVAGLAPNFSGLVGTYYQNRYLNYSLENNQSYWIYPPADYYNTSGLFSTAWSPVGGLSGYNSYAF